MDYVNKGQCFYPEGNLWICYENNKILLKRCCIHKPFKELSLKEFYLIDDIINYSLFDKDLTDFISNKDRCKTCYVHSDIKRVSVSISHACNFKCYHCFFKEHKDTSEMKKAYFDTLYKIKGHQLDYILLTDAGEPFFYYYATIDFLKSLSLNDTKNVRITTNLSFLNEDRIKQLKDISMSTHVNYEFIVSINGITKETYEATRIGGNFEKCMKNLKCLSQYFDNIVISYVITDIAKAETLLVKDFFKKTFNLKADLYPDYYDENIKLFFKNLKEG